MEKFDLVVIGAGPAGYVAAIKAAQLNLRTAIIDREWLGGVCLNVGCIPSKALLRNSEIAFILREKGKEFGFSFDNLSLDFSVAVKRSRQVSTRLVKGIEFLMKKNGIKTYIGAAKIIATKTIEIADSNGKTEKISAQNIIIASGASPIVPAGWPLDGKTVLTYREAILQESLPKDAVIIGAGPIGVEFATIWNSYGANVTLLEMMPTILPLEDPEASAELEKACVKRKMNVLTGRKVEHVELKKEGARVTVSKGTERTELTADQVLIAIGFKPNSENIGLEIVGVERTDRGFIKINDKMETNIPGIYAIGDVTGKLMLAHVGSAMGIICAENIAGKTTVKLDYEMMPRATYSSPQVASFGVSEAIAKERGLNVKVAKFPFQANGKALGLGEYAGWVKLIVDQKYGEILGAVLVGPEVTELLPELTLAHMMELTPTEIARNVHAHPTLSETLMEAAHAVEGNAIHI